MKALRTLLFALMVAAGIPESWQTEELVPGNDPCRLFPDKTLLRKPGTCNEGIICENFKSVHRVTCLGSTPWYSLTSNSCVAKQPTDKYCKQTCKTTSPRFVSDTKNCHDWFVCQSGKKINEGTCPAGQVFNQKQQMCTYDSTCVKTYEICDIVKPGVRFADENNCNKYHECKSGSQLSIACPTGKYYEKGQGDCDAKAQVECYRHPYPNEVCGNSKISYRNKFVSDGATCRGYFFCTDKGAGVPDKSPAWGQCTINEFFNPIEQACQPRNHVKCDEDRCDGRYQGQKEISSTKGCQHYLICGDGYTKDEVYCGDGLYYDPDTQQCTTVQKTYGACA